MVSRLSKLTRLLVFGMLTCSATLLAGDDPDGDARKQAWEWTLEERLTNRFDPSNIQEREVAYQAAHYDQLKSAGLKSVATAAQPKGALAYTIDGRRDPELFLPHELLDALTTGFLPDLALRAKQRGYYRSGVREHFLDDDVFWSQLASVCSTYVSLKYDADSHTPRPTAEDLCRARHRALQSARDLFGHQRFDQFLYAVIAPAEQYATMTSSPDPIGDLRRIEQGCQP
jgi:hypothetical protein